MKFSDFVNVLALAFMFVCSSAQAASDRVALVIGNSKYESLGVLSNTANDAKAVDKALRDMGYKSKLVLDATDSQIRKDIRKFASDTDGAAIAVLFYAGHGAQVNGDNFLLPVDMEAPQRESDIQISGFKVDDILNSMKSSTKVVFLDACRDNPALMKSMVKGRGVFRGGLAPANSSNIDSSNGVFIAYATSAGDVALDGEGQKNSPFTSALLKYVKEPVSIDDMFSKVTREVKSSTGNKQRPYKYASLDNVVCLPGACSKGGGFIANETQKSSPSNSGVVLDKAVQERDNVSSSDLVSTTSLDNWLIFESQTDNHNYPVFINPSSWKKINSRALISIKWSEPSSFVPDIPEKKMIKFGILGYAIDCSTKKVGLTDAVFLDKNGVEIARNRFGNPAFVPLTLEYPVKSSIGYTFVDYACSKFPESDVVSTASVSNSKNWDLLYDIDANRSLYYLKGSRKRNGDTGFITTKVEAKQPISVETLYPVFKGVPGLPLIKTTVYQNQFDCSNKQFFSKSAVVYGTDGTPIGIQNTWTGENLKPVPVGPELEQLYIAACQR